MYEMFDITTLALVALAFSVGFAKGYQVGKNDDDDCE